MRVAGDDELGGTFVCKIFDRCVQCGYASASEAIRAVIGEKPQNGSRGLQLCTAFQGIEWASSAQSRLAAPNSSSLVKAQPAVTPRGFTFARMNSMMLSIGVPG